MTQTSVEIQITNVNVFAISAISLIMTSMM